MRLQRQEQTLDDKLRDGFKTNKSRDTTLHVRILRHSYVLPKIDGIYIWNTPVFRVG